MSKENKISEEFLIPEKYRYSYFYEHRYEMNNDVLISSGLEYEIICNNGFIKLYTIPGKLYWLAQNEFGHLTPDWKFHISISDENLEKAWDIVASEFVKNQLKGGLKIKYHKENSNSVKGREITVYIPVWIQKFEESNMFSDYNISKNDIENTKEKYISFFNTVEKKLKEFNIRTNGIAEGELKLGDYISLRNESYCFDKNSQLDIYPPDNRGWNSTNQALPFSLSDFRKKNFKLSSIIFILGLFVLYYSYYFLL